MKILNILILYITLITCLTASEVESGPMTESEATEKIDLIFESLSASDFEKMANLISSATPPLIGYRISVLQFFETSMKPKLPAYGALKDISLIATQWSSTKIEKRIYLVEFQKSYLVWSFKLYHATDGLYFKGFSIDANEDEALIFSIKRSGSVAGQDRPGDHSQVIP